MRVCEVCKVRVCEVCKVCGMQSFLMQFYYQELHLYNKHKNKKINIVVLHSHL